jgi:DNA-binding HxlR family transcriptional regulator
MPELHREAGAAPEVAGTGRGAHRQWTPLARALTIAGDGWTLAIVAELAPGPMRLSALQARLGGVSAGLLDRRLRRMAEDGLLTRSRHREIPPRVELALTEAGHELLPVAAALARWGLRRGWGPPLAGERVDLDALLRQLPLQLGSCSPPEHSSPRGPAI